MEQAGDISGQIGRQRFHLCDEAAVYVSERKAQAEDEEACPGEHVYPSYFHPTNTD